MQTASEKKNTKKTHTNKITIKRLNPALSEIPLGPCRLGEAAEIRHTV